MRTTLTRIDVGSAFRVGLVLYALLAAVFGLIFVGMQALFLTGVSSMARTAPNAADLSFFTTAGIAGLCIFYGVLVVFSAIGGGIQFALLAFFYNLTANWMGGIKVELETEESDLLDDVARSPYRR